MIPLAGLLALVVLYAPVVIDLVRVWSDDSYYSYGFLVPVFSGYLLWDARRLLVAEPTGRRREGLAVIAGALLLLAAAAALESLTLAAVSLTAAVAGVALYALGRRRFRLVRFPIAFLAFMAPLPEGAVPALSLALQHLVTTVTHQMLVALGISVVRDGLLLHLAPLTLEITEACNGLRFLLAMLVVGTAFAGITQRRAGDRAAVVAGAVALAIAGNLLRVGTTAVLADRFGAAAATGFFHIAWGKAVYGVMLVPFVALVVGLRRRARLSEETA